MHLEVSYEDRQGEQHTDVERIQFQGTNPSTALRKGVLLSRYASLLRAWIVHDRADTLPQGQAKPPVEAYTRDFLERRGIPVHIPEYRLGRWERQSQPLRVSQEYTKIFQIFARSFGQQAQIINDPVLDQEEEILERLMNWSGRSSEAQGKRDDWEYDEDEKAHLGSQP